MATSAQAASGSTRTSSSAASLDAAAIALLAQLPVPKGAVPLVEATKDAPAGATLDGRLQSVAEEARRATNKRRRIAGLIVGEIAEQEFERKYRTVMKGQQFDFEDQRASANETDFLVLDAQKRRAFRINIKSHGTFFEGAERFVNLKPEDTFGLATYKIKDANRRSAEEALPFLFAIVSSSALATGPIADALPKDVGFVCDGLSKYRGIKGIRTLENGLVAYMLDPGGQGSTRLIQGLRTAVRNANWRVISAVKAEHLMNELMWKRVPALATRNFSGDRESQANMHFSMGNEMVDLDALLVLLRDHGIQHVATKIAYHQI